MNVCNIQPGDLIFSYYKQRIVSISSAKTAAYDAPIPREWENVHDWYNDGWKVSVEYSDLENPPHIKDFRDFYMDIHNFPTPAFFRIRSNISHNFDIQDFHICKMRFSENVSSIILRWFKVIGVVKSISKGSPGSKIQK